MLIVLYLQKIKGNDGMGYSLKSLTAELVNKNMANDGLVAFGQNTSGLGGILESLGRPMHAISMVGEQIVITPFTNKEIIFNKAIAFPRKNIQKAKVSGLLTGQLTIVMNGGSEYKYNITQGKPAVKQILSRLGL